MNPILEHMGLSSAVKKLGGDVLSLNSGNSSSKG